MALGQELAPPGDNSTAENYVALLVIVGGAAAAGHVMRVRGEENRRPEALTVQLAAEHDLRARAAVVEERARVARELHDIVAHSVSLIAVQAGAAEKLMGRDEARARHSLQAVQETARGALGEMRRLLTALYADDDEAPGLAPQPGLADVARLVEQARAGGLPVALREDGARPKCRRAAVRAHLARARRAAPRRPRAVQRRDRRPAVPLRGDGQDPPHADPGQARAAGKGAGCGAGLRDGLVEPGGG